MLGIGGLIESVDILLPELPARLEGLRIAHLSDLHVVRPRRRHERIVTDLAYLKADLVFLTGDYITRPGQEPAALAFFQRLCDAVRPRYGFFGVFGNHDTSVLSRELARFPMQWLNNTAVELPDLPLEILGLQFLDGGQQSADTIATLAACNRSSRSAGRQSIRLMLCHYAEFLPVAADMGVQLMFCGHTHGGQCRLPGRRALLNRCGLPLRLTCGLLRHKDTLCVVSRGLGETRLPLRTFCPPQLPLLTLRRGPMLGQPTHRIVNLQPW